LKNVVRPVSVGVFGDKIMVLASSVKDSSFLAVLNPEPVACVTEDGYDTLKAVNLVGFGSNARYFQVVPPDNEIIVVGTNPLGYDINVIDITEGLENMGVASSFHYHVPKQSERIQASDPHGLGLAVVAISVVFFALICVMSIMFGYGGLIQRIQNRNKKDAKGTPAAAVAKASGSDGEVYAAIAAAIYAYSQDLHDVEDTVITIQKVERAWTPWNAKFYNMNKYFSERPNMPHKSR
jgi:Na+-transporting methylmalonyl-CoA/oxaloacetate decarboxylase gamma subunit